MAELQKIRNRAGLLIGIVGFALLAFIIPWSALTTMLNNSRDKAFIVNGETVKTGTWQTRIAEMEDFRKIMNRGSLTEEQQAQLKEQVYKQMVQEMMIGDQAQKIGIGLSEAELNDMVYGDNPSPILYQLFYDNAKKTFNKEALQNFMADVNKNIGSVPPEQQAAVKQEQAMWSVLVRQMKDQRLSQKYQSLLASAITVNDLEAKNQFEGSNTTANIAYVQEPYASIADSTVKVSDSEIANLYKERKENFKLQSKLAKITYFVKDILPSEDDYAAVQKEIEDVYKKMLISDNPMAVIADNSDQQPLDCFIAEKDLPLSQQNFVKTASVGDTFAPVRGDQVFTAGKLIDKTVAPDSVRLQLIGIPSSLDKTIGKRVADSLVTVIKKGKDFAAVANEINPNAHGGEAGWVREYDLTMSHLNKDFIKNVFAAQKGEILTVDLNGGIQIVRVEDKSKPVAKVKLAVLNMPVTVSDRTMSNIDTDLNKFISQNGDVKKFESEANKKGYNVLSNIMIAPSQQSISQISGSRQVIHWAFNEKVGSVKKFDLNDKRVVALITSQIDDEFMPETEPQIQELLKAELLKDKKAAKIIANLKKESSLDGYATAMNSKVDTVKFVNFESTQLVGLNAYEPYFNLYSKDGQVNQLAGPLKGETGVFVLNVLNKTKQDTQYDKDVVKNSLLSKALNQQRLNYLMVELESKMGVKDNRVAFN